MTSHEKDNWRHVQEILEKNNWFGRRKRGFDSLCSRWFLLSIRRENGSGARLGNCFSNRAVMAPFGNWREIMEFSRGFDRWEENMLSIRQINNPLAGIDYGLLAFPGSDCKERKILRICFVPRVWAAAEGVNVMVERKMEKGYSYVLSNIEYCDFSKYAIEDLPVKRRLSPILAIIEHEYSLCRSRGVGESR